MGYPIYHSQYTAAQIEAAIGKGPRVNTDGYWEVWNVGTGAYESTGVGAGVTPPTVVTQVSQMTNHGYIYIYNGAETGYTAGYWYYWDGSAWAAGGAYQVAATDTTLTVAGAAADAKVTGDKIGELKSAIDYAGLIAIPMLYTGKYYNTSGATIDPDVRTSSGNFDCTVVDCTPGDKFTINATGGGSAAVPWAFIDSSNNVLLKSDVTTSGAYEKDVIIIAPTNAVKLLINNRKTSTPDAKSFYGQNIVSRENVTDTRLATIESDLNAMNYSGVPLALNWQTAYYRNESAGTVITTRAYSAGTPDYFMADAGSEYKWVGNTKDTGNNYIYALVHEFDSSKTWLRATRMLDSGTKTSIRTGTDCAFVQFFVLSTDTGITFNSGDFALFAVSGTVGNKKLYIDAVQLDKDCNHVTSAADWKESYYRNTSAGTLIQSRKYTAGTPNYFIASVGQTFRWTGKKTLSSDSDYFRIFIHEFNSSKTWLRATEFLNLNGYEVATGANCAYVQFFVTFDDTTIVVDPTYFSMFDIHADDYIVETINTLKSTDSTLANGVRSNSQRLSAIEAKTDIPDYWETYLDERIPEIQDALTNGTSGDTVIFFTDYHKQYNAKQSPKLMKKISELCGIEKVIFGGDMLDGMTQEDTEKLLADVDVGLNEWKPILPNLYPIVGNHERGGSFADWSLLYSAFGKRRENEIGWVDEYGNYWVDNVPQKIRYFFVISSSSQTLSEEQLSSIEGELANVPNGYTIVLVSHFGLKYSEDESHSVSIYNSTYEALFGYLDTINTVNHPVACVLSGHNHTNIDLTTTSGIPIISVQTDAYNKSLLPYQTEPMVQGTATEQAFEVVAINKSTKKVNCYRIGAGEDREFTYS